MNLRKMSANPIVQKCYTHSKHLGQNTFRDIRVLRCTSEHKQAFLSSHVKSQLYKPGLIGQQMALNHPKLWEPAPKVAPMILTHLLVFLLLCSPLPHGMGLTCVINGTMWKCKLATLLTVLGVGRERQLPVMRTLSPMKRPTWLRTQVLCRQPALTARCVREPHCKQTLQPVQPSDDCNLLETLSQLTHLSHSWIPDPVYLYEVIHACFKLRSVGTPKRNVENLMAKALL